MKRNLFWKFVFVVFLTAWALWEMYPPTPRNLLGEFTQRAANKDATFTNIVQKAVELEQARPDSTFANLREAIGTNSIAPYFPFVQVQAKKEANLAVLHRLQQDASGNIKLGLDLQGGTEFLVGFATNRFEEFVSEDALEASGHRERMLSQSIEVLRKRVDRFGVAEPILQPMGDDRILVQLPGLSEADKESAKAQIQRAAFLEFRLVHENSAELIRQGLIPAGFEVLQMQRTHRDGREELTSYLVRKPSRKAEQNLTGRYVRRAYVTPDNMTGMPQIALSFDRDGAIMFGRITQESVGRQLAIILDGEIYSAPVIRVPILDGNAVIEGDFTMTEAIELSNILQNPLEAPLELLSERSVEPSLGKDNIRSGIIAAIVGAITVSMFMLIYYLFAGLAANVALLLNLIILMGVMASVGSTLTLPGIAGIVLTIGMAVDANVLIYERIREELKKGKSLRGAVTAGYDRAFGTILDSNITTLIASVILVFFGTGPVKGFGVTLTIGIAASMFTALVVTRMLFDYALEKQWVKSLRMLSVIGDTSIDFMRYAKPAFILSWVVILVGIGWGLHRGKGALGPDFIGGDNLILTFSQTVDVNEYRERVRETVQNTGVRDAMVQFQSDLATGYKTLRITTPFGFGGEVERAIQEQFPEAGFRQIELQAVGPTVGREILRSALVACLLAIFGILIYVALRFEFSFAVGAVVAVAHDVLMTAGIYVLVGREFNATVVAAMLTIMGFSINDTIVIFDRIREDLKLGLRGSFSEIINFALNQTLSRTIITSGTTLLATLALYLFGGGAINDFAFTFLVGVIAGCYSSIYIASALVLWWHKGERPKASTQIVIDTDAVTARA
jgi:SecD/SecF fusion protein